MKKALVLIDLQNDYFPGGNMELVDTEKAATNAQMLLNRFRNDDLSIVHVRHISIRAGATFFLPGTRGAAIHDMVTPNKGESLVTKHYPNSFRDTPLLSNLRKDEITDLIICGAMSHMCIDATTRAAFDYGFNCVVAEDACATKELIFKGRTIKASDVHASFMAALSAPYARVLTTKDTLKDI